MEKVLLHARKYLERGFSVIPCGKDKKPLISWKEYQSKRATEKEVTQWVEQFPEMNIGIVTGSISGGLGVIDIDDEQEAWPVLETLLPKELQTVGTMTPSGGKHLWFFMKDELSNNARVIPGADFRGEGGYVVVPPSVNGTGKGYHFLKDMDLWSHRPAPLPQKYIDYVSKSPDALKLQDKQNVTESYELFKKGRRDEDLFHAANCLVKGGMQDFAVKQVITALALSCVPPFNLKEAESKVESAIERCNQRNRLIAAEVRDWVDGYKGYFNITDVYRDVYAVTKAQKTAVRVALHRMAEKGQLQKHLTKAACYRRVESVSDPIDYLSAPTQDLNIRWPLGIHNLVRMYPGNIAVVAGTSNAGKTAFLLNFVEKNMDKHKINYFSSEMGSVEVRTRLEMFDRDLESWNFQCFERSSNFEDAIRPGEINIIDYMEMEDNFFQVSGKLRAIHDAMKGQSLTIVAIQKKHGADTGRGGEFSLEKPRLYLSIDPNRCKIVKAKNWVHANPNNLECEFSIVNGSVVEKRTEWQLPE